MRVSPRRQLSHSVKHYTPILVLRWLLGVTTWAWRCFRRVLSSKRAVDEYRHHHSRLRQAPRNSGEQARTGGGILHHTERAESMVMWETFSYCSSSPYCTLFRTRLGRVEGRRHTTSEAGLVRYGNQRVIRSLARDRNHQRVIARADGWDYEIRLI
jgi:hypothetical protein